MQDKVTITWIEYEEYKKLKKYKDLAIEQFWGMKAYILQLKILAESIDFSAVSSDDIKNLMTDNIDDLFRAANECDDLIHNYIDFTVKM